MRSMEFVSVDDHLIEPPHLWASRLPKKHVERGPKVISLEPTPDVLSRVPEDNRPYISLDSGPVDFWSFEDLLVSNPGTMSSAGEERSSFSNMSKPYSAIHPGCFDPIERTKMMDRDGVVASLCFPTFGRFCLQTFSEAQNKELGLLCIQAYNDFILDEWHAAAPGRHIPLCGIPLWDPALAVAEIHRVAAKGARAITFSENPAKLGWPSIHDEGGYWDPVFAAVSEAGLPLCVHIGSSSEMIVPSKDAPVTILYALATMGSQVALADWLLSGVFLRHPKLELVLAEGGIGWIPYALDRADRVWLDHGAWTKSPLDELPSTFFSQHIYGCFIDDPHGARSIHEIGVDRVMIETDYPHSDSTFPHSRARAEKHLAPLTDEEFLAVTRGNAERVFNFQASALGTLS